MKSLKQLSRFSKYAWGLLAYNLLVILWGAYVRASGSGAGCGSHWPLCNGEVIPRSPRIETVIEFTHRLSSGLVLPLVFLLVLWAWRKFPARSAVRVGAALSLLFTITEALVGAGLVLFGLTAENDSLARAVVMMAHLVNTFLLLALLTLTAWWSAEEAPGLRAGRGRLGLVFAIALLGAGLIGASGAVAALGDTLFPATSLSSALTDDFSETAHILVRLRVLHPGIAVMTGLLIGGFALWLRRRFNHPTLQRFSLGLLVLIGLQWTLGLLNVILLAPVWMQIIHLLVADLVWIQLVLLAAVVLGSADLLIRLPEQQIHHGVDDPQRVAQ